MSTELPFLDQEKWMGPSPPTRHRREAVAPTWASTIKGSLSFRKYGDSEKEGMYQT